MTSNREKFLLKVISPAIRGQNCPICLKDLLDHRRAAVIPGCLHSYCLRCIRKWSDLKRTCPLCNAAFDSLFCNISFSSRSFLTETLPPLDKGTTVISQHPYRFSSVVSHRRVSRSRQLPWRRTFGRPGSVSCDVIAERKLQWRASVYKRGLQAVPSSVRNCVQQNTPRAGYSKEKVLQRIEPWIRRELQAILEDPDPSVIVHVASSLYIATLEGTFDASTIQLGVEYDFLAPLQPFLHKWTNLFWHELSCFAETSLNMDTYDSVITYKKSAQVFHAQSANPEQERISLRTIMRYNRAKGPILVNCGAPVGLLPCYIYSVFRLRLLCMTRKEGALELQAREFRLTSAPID
ncbi:RING/U-box superfamily protein [Euphorbia peplus]|nr:RING/U-box superfamily protein [Euphorbia peplus]